jgi:uncharacterized membrane protein YsdA (DUF1294 family)
MPPEFIHPLIIFLAAISFAGLLLVIVDKRNSRHRGRQRVPERILVFTGILGGAVVMLAAMLMIRHKTKHAKFMLGFPLIIVLQFALALLLTQV